MFIPLVLLIIGLVWLLNVLGILQGQVWEIIWPCVLIVFAISLLIKRDRANNFYSFGKKIHAEFKDHDND